MSTPASDLNRLAPGQVRAFANSLTMRAQQRKGRIAAAVTADLGYSEKGVSFTDEILESFEAEDFDGDIAPLPVSTTQQARREARFRSYRISKDVGTREKAEKLIDPSNTVLMAMSAALARKEDKNILGTIGKVGGIFGDTIEVDADDDFNVVSFPGTQIVANNENTFYKGYADGASAPTAPVVLSRQKLARARILLNASLYAEIDNDVPHALVEQKDFEAFATAEELLNRDYNSSNDEVKRFRNEIGKEAVSMYDGIMYHKVADGMLPNVPGQSSRFYIPVFYKSALLYKRRVLVGTRVQERQETSYRWNAYFEAQHATLRTEDKAVVWMDCTRPA